MRRRLRTVGVALSGSLYVSLFWLKAPAGWPTWLGASRRFLIDRTHALSGLPMSWSWTLMSVILGALIPALLLLLWRRPGMPSFLGPGRRETWRMVAVAVALSLPALLWLASRPEFRNYYVSMFRRDWLAPATRFVLVITAEHICIQGLILRLSLPAFSDWPPAPSPPVDARLHQRALWWLGLGRGPGLARRLGVDGAVLAALAVQAFAFGWVHLSKDPGELLLSFPGGFAIGYLAFRARSVWPCVAIHSATGAAVILFAWMWGMPIGR